MDIPLLAADWVGVIVGIIFLLVSAASAIGNIVKEKNQPQPGKAKEKATLQKELEKFLQEAMNPQPEKRQPQKKEKPAEVDFFEDDFVEAQATTAPEPPPRRRRQQRQSLPPKAQSQPAPKPKSSGSSQLSHRQRAEQNAEERKKRLGGKVRERIKKKQQSHVESRLTTHIESNVGKQLLADSYGPGSADQSKSSSKSGGGKAVRSLLRNPQTVRQAIIVNEILSPPKSRRRS